MRSSSTTTFSARFTSASLFFVVLLRRLRQALAEPSV